MFRGGILGPDHFGVILDCVADGVFTVSRQWVVTFFNRAAEEISGIDRADALGQRCSDVLRTDMCAEDCALRHTMHTGSRVVGRHVTITRADGRKKPVSVSTALLRNAQGEVVGGVETFRDLTDVEDLRDQLLRRFTVSNIVTRSRKMRDILDLLPRVAASNATCLVGGESGTGKELLARAIHRLSGSSGGPFVAVNCGALPDTLLESELFGHEAGAFTDAKRSRQGRFASAQGGTIFLDEIGDVSPALQVRLLRVLQEKEYQPLGSDDVLRSDARVIAATNRNLEEMVRRGEFRSDLYYRLNVVSVVVPPLRERPEDIPLLCQHFIGRYSRSRRKDISGVSEDVLTKFMTYPWPGNVRELENSIEYAFILCPGGLIQQEHLPDYMRDRDDATAVSGSTLADIEGGVILRTLRRNDGHRGRTARELGISKSTLWRKLKALGVAGEGGS